MKRILLQKVQYLIQERNHERAMREVLQIIKPSSYANKRELMTEAAKLRDKYSTHAICDALQIARGTFLNHIFRSKGENSVYAIRDRQLGEEIMRIFEENDSILGADKIAAIIRQNGTPVTEKKVRKLMRAMGRKSGQSSSRPSFHLLKRTSDPSWGFGSLTVDHCGGSREIRNIVIVCSVMYLPVESGIENRNITENRHSLGNSSYSQNSPFLSTFSTRASPRRFVSIMTEQAICRTP